MRHKKQFSIGNVLLAFAFLLMLLPYSSVVYAENAYEPLAVKLPYRHLYTTTDVEVDSLFHYLVSPEDGAPLPKEADEDGVFAFQGVSGSGTADGDNTVFDLQGNLTFEFQKPGVYSYELKADLDADSKKVNDSRYTIPRGTVKVTFYIENDPDHEMQLTMLTAEKDNDVKPNEVEFDPVYKGDVRKPEKDPDDPVDKEKTGNKGGSSRTVKSGPHPRTSDDTNAKMYLLMGLFSAAVVLVLLRMKFKNRKGSEDNA